MVKPLFIPRGGGSDGTAIFVIKPGMYVVETSHSRSSEEARVYRVVSIGDGNISANLQAAANAALEKTYCLPLPLRALRGEGVA